MLGHLTAYLSNMLMLKTSMRSDSFWVSRLLYRDPIRRIPIYFDTRTLLKSQYWSRERLDRLVDARLNAIAQRIAVIPMWKQRFIDAGISIDDFNRKNLARLPLLTKEYFTSHDVTDYTNSDLLKKSHTDHTSGSTGKPFQFFLDWRAELRYFAIRERMLLSASGGDSLPVIYFRARINPGFFFGRHKLFFLRGYNTIRHRLPELAEFIKKQQRDVVIYGYTSSFVELGRRVTEMKLNLPIRAVVATGEGIRESDRAYIEESLGAKFFLTYATWEVKWIGFECARHRCHINEEYVYVETVDEGGNPLPIGSEGRVVVTSFDSESMPFVRYVLGDRGVISNEPCPCGRTLRTITIYGRQSDVIALPDGRTVPLFDVSTAFDTSASAIRQYQIVQTGPSSFHIKVVVTKRFEQVRENLERRLIAILHPQTTITWEEVDEIPQAASGKAAYFIRAY